MASKKKERHIPGGPYRTRTKHRKVKEEKKPHARPSFAYQLGGTASLWNKRRLSGGQKEKVA